MKDDKLPLRTTANVFLGKAHLYGTKALRVSGDALTIFWQWLRRVFTKDSVPYLLLVMTVITIAVAAGIGALHTVTEPRIEAARDSAFEDAMRAILRDEELLFSKSLFLGENVYEARDAEGHLSGFAVRISMQGLAGPVHMVVGVSTLREVIGVTVVSHRETGDISAYTEQGVRLALSFFEREVEP